MARRVIHRWVVGLLFASSLVTAAAAPATASPAAGPLPVGVPPDGAGGQAVVWGEDARADLTVPASLSGKTVIAVSAGADHDLALTSDGQVTEWGNFGFPPPASLEGKTVTAIAAGNGYSLALTSDGRVTVWGYNFGGILGDGALNDKTVTAIAAGADDHALALTSDGQVIAWGSNYEGQTDVPASLTQRRVVAIAAGEGFSEALTSDGQVVVWGDDRLGETDVPASLAGKAVIDIAAGSTRSIALTSDGTVTTWGGTNAFGELDVPASLAGKSVTAVAVGYAFSLALTSDGTVVAWGDDTYGESDVPPALTGRTHAIAAGENAIAIATPGPDYVAPVLTVTDGEIQTKTIDPAGAVVTFPTPTAVDAVDGALPVTCTLPSGSLFPVGVTRSVCSATDSAGNVGRVEVVVIVRLGSTRIGVTAVSPVSGSVAGGTVVTLTGHGFTGAQWVEFGYQGRTTDFTVDSDTQITVVVPASSQYRGAGFVHVIVHGHGTSTGFVYNRFHYLPDITAVTPTGGSSGTPVRITGHGFTGARTVTFGAVPARSFTVVSDTQVTAVAPDLPAGPVDVRVNVAGGTTAIIAADHFTGS